MLVGQARRAMGGGGRRPRRAKCRHPARPQRRSCTSKELFRRRSTRTLTRSCEATSVGGSQRPACWARRSALCFGFVSLVTHDGLGYHWQYLIVSPFASVGYYFWGACLWAPQVGCGEGYGRVRPLGDANGNPYASQWTSQPNSNIMSKISNIPSSGGGE